MFSPEPIRMNQAAPARTTARTASSFFAISQAAARSFRTSRSMDAVEDRLPPERDGDAVERDRGRHARRRSRLQQVECSRAPTGSVRRSSL
jgi:hypothetical protein